MFNFILSLALLIIGAELIVRGASSLAKAFGISSLVIGLTIVALGTSAPELAVGIQAVFTGHPDLIIGNCVGSTICNILFILGGCAMIAPLIVTQQLIWLDVPIMIGAHVALWLMSLNGFISRWNALTLFAALVFYTLFIIRKSRKESADILKEYEEAFPGNSGAKTWAGIAMQTLMVVVGLCLITFGADLLVKSAEKLARAFGISELIIGLTIVSVGTSVPELATSIIATLKGERDIAIGNIVGSCIFNILGIIGVIGLVAPDGIEVDPSVLKFDLPVAIAACIACLPIFFTGHKISRWEGALFFGYYAAYIAFLILRTQKQEAAPMFNMLMLGFIIPLMAITFLIIFYRAIRQHYSK